MRGAFALLMIPAALASQGSRCPAASADTAALAPSDVDRPPVADSANPSPPYPDLLRQAGIGGTVQVTFTIDTTGRAEPRSIRIARSPNPGFDASVKRTVASWRYVPASLCGRPVRVRLSHDFVFSTAADTLRLVLLFEDDTTPTVASDTLPGGSILRIPLSATSPIARAALVAWDAAALDSAEEAALADVVRSLSRRHSALTPVACLKVRSGDPDVSRLARITSPGIAVLPMRRCPPTFVSMIYQPKQLPDPPGDDPFHVDVRTRSPFSPSRALFDVDVTQGTRGDRYRCGVERRADGWRARCLVVSSWIS